MGREEKVEGGDRGDLVEKKKSQKEETPPAALSERLPGQVGRGVGFCRDFLVNT